MNILDIGGSEMSNLELESIWNVVATIWRHYFANKSPSSQSYGFSSSHVWMGELDYKESWAPKNWCFWTVVLEKTERSEERRSGSYNPGKPAHWAESNSRG